MTKRRMFIQRWNGGWRWYGQVGWRTYDLGWVETMPVAAALREFWWVAGWPV